MASAYLDSTTGELVPAASGKIIRVRRLVVSADANGWFQLKHSMGTDDEGEVTQKFYMRAAGVSAIDLWFHRETPQTPREATLDLDSNLLLNSYSVYVEYELVD